MIAISLIAAYLFTCWLAYRIFIDAWTFELDVDRGDLHFFMWVSVFGPFSLLIAAVLWLTDSAGYRNRNRNNEIIYPRKETK